MNNKRKSMNSRKLFLNKYYKRAMRIQLNEDSSFDGYELEQSTSGSNNLFHNDSDMCVSTINNEYVATANSDSQESNLSLVGCIGSFEEELIKSDDQDQAFLLNLNSDPSTHKKVDEHSLTPQLAMWALEHNVPHNAVNHLLRLLQPHFSELPKDARKLLKTPRKVFPTIIAPGIYYHIGLKNCLEKLVNRSTNNISQSDSTLQVCINIDGLPISKSSGGQLYPILGSLFTNKNNVETIGIYHGNEKPATANDFLRAFVDEAKHIITNGFIYKDRIYEVKIKMFICDVPAKALIKYTTGHAGYFSCSKCEIEGIYLNRRTCFPQTDNLTLRSDSDFRMKKQNEHHTGTSILEEIPGLDMIAHFPLDYMHLVCLGVVKKMIVNLWMNGKPPNKFSFHEILDISDSLLQLVPYIPHEFCRKPRALKEANRWKATEFRLFLFYTGPVVLKNKVDSDKYKKILCLHVAMTLLSTSKYQENIEYANSLLKYFVKTFIILYGKQHVSHNVHNLLHICDDIANFGILDQFSAFPFENYMQTFKKMIRKSEKPLQQIICRLNERHLLNETSNIEENVDSPQVEHFNGPLLSSLNIMKQFSKINLGKNCLLSISEPNHCCCLVDNSIVIIKNIVTVDLQVIILVQKFLKLTDFYISPCKSSELGIYLDSTHDMSSLQPRKISDILHKCVILPIGHNRVIIPLLHLQ